MLPLWKLPASIGALAIAVAVLTGALGYAAAREEIEQAADARLAVEVEAGRAVFAQVKTRLRSALSAQAVSAATAAAMIDFARAMAVDGPAMTARVAARIVAPPGPGARAALNGAPNGSAYGRAHDVSHEQFKGAVLGAALDDGLLLDLDGSVIYSIGKGMNVARGAEDIAFGAPALARLFGQMRQREDFAATFEDFAS